MSRALRLLLILLVILALPLAAGLTYQAIGSARDREILAAVPGTRVATPSGAMHIQCLALDKAGPTVLLEAGFGGPGLVFARLLPKIAEAAPVCAYDRLGQGLSDPRRGPADAGTIAAELNALLEAAPMLRNREGRFVLAGFSLGGGFAQVFAARHPEKIAGLVLIDSVHPQQYERLGPKARETQAQLESLFRIGGPLATFGVMRFLDPYRAVASLLDEPQASQFAAMSQRPSYWADTYAEARDWQQTMTQLREATWPPAVPAATIAADRPSVSFPADQMAAWSEMQRDYASAPGLVAGEIAQGANHFTLVMSEPYATQAANVILAVVRRARGE
jgi:pimeloyl-ACP methyl ester carboxylesterase